MTSQGPMYVWAASVALAIVVAGWTAVNRPTVRAALPLEHVAGATLVALFGWQILVYLPEAIAGYGTLTAGLGDVRGLEGRQALLVAQAAFVVAAAFAVAGTLRRRAWGSVLGIGLALAIVVRVGLTLFETMTLYAASMEPSLLSLVVSVVGQQMVPALAAAALLAWPLIRRTGHVVSASG